ncbi:hypothetical protein BFJ65_g7547 [Fusarium oxysporum f. sp. cepae]|uniref:F-box domain-containing protein n=1 Tax=Fusarium oxysporum f. sp. cepae TaxID=396571 RepID=A0A3L6NSA4_FUSOX|nr:hypothetical protein BFJ65_g7547 [Fusarium oxysporum f. sp. cepae]
MVDCHILRLPDEIHVAVAKLLPGSAIKSIRATCTKLNGIASPFLYPVLYLSCHQLDLDVFQLVAGNPLLIGGVKELVIDDTTLSPRLADREVYKTVASYPHLWPKRKKAYYWGETFEEEGSGRIWSDKPHKEFWTLYNAVLQGHHENRRSHADINALRKALPLFKSLRSLVISNRTADDCFDSGAQSEESSSPVVKMWRRLGVSKLERPPFPPRCDWVVGWDELAEAMYPDWFYDELDRQINEYGLPPANGEVNMTRDPDGQFPVRGNRMSYQEVRTASSFDWTDYNWLESESEAFCHTVGQQARGIFIALVVLGNPRIQLTEFRVDSSLEVYQAPHQPGLSVQLFNSNKSPFPRQLVSSFSTCNLTKFHLVLSNYWDPSFVGYVGGFAIQNRNIAALLASMPQLEDLLLELHGMSFFLAMPADIKYDRLRRVEFSCGEIAPLGLVEFVQRHAATLETLSVQYCCIDPHLFAETWEDVMREIQNLQDEGTLKIHDGELVNVYVHRPCRGCGKNRTLELDGTDSLICSWEFGCFSTRRKYLEWSWDLPSNDEAWNDGTGRDGDSEGEAGGDEDADNEDGDSD